MRWCRQHPEPLLTGAAFVLTVWLSATGSGGWHLDAGHLALAVAVWLPLLVRNRWPLAVLGAVAVLDAVRAIVIGHNEPSSGTLPVATIFACYTVGVQRPLRIAWSAVAAAAIVQFGIVTIHFRGTGLTLLYFNWALVGVAVGSLVAERRRRLLAAEERAKQAERTKEEEARRRVTAERVRIARELHDSLAHHITVVNAQAGVAQYLMRDSPDAAEAALSGIVENTRAALDELRATLGLLRDERSGANEDQDRIPTPGLGQLESLLEQMRRAGMALEVDMAGDERPVSAVTDLAAYRIIQEALSNAARHAPGSAVTVALRWTDDDLELTIVNREAVHRVPAAQLVREGSGYGVIGMRERAATAGGRFDARPTPDGGFVVDAVLPLDGRGVLEQQPASEQVQ